jgi:hypothetical protein
MQWQRRLIAGFSSWTPVSSNAVSCGIYGREIGNESGISPSPSVLPSVRTTPPQVNAPSFVYQQLLAAVSVFDKLKIC